MGASPVHSPGGRLLHEFGGAGEHPARDESATGDDNKNPPTPEDSTTHSHHRRERSSTRKQSKSELNTSSKSNKTELSEDASKLVPGPKRISESSTHEGGALRKSESTQDERSKGGFMKTSITSSMTASPKSPDMYEGIEGGHEEKSKSK